MQAKYLIENRVKTEVEIAQYIKREISTDEMLNKLGMFKRVHLTGTVLPQIRAIKEEGTNLKDVMQAIKDEQKLLAGLHGELKHSNPVLIELAEQAHGNQQLKTVEHLEKAAYNIVKEGIRSEGEMTTILKASTDIRKTHKKLELNIERHKINQSIKELEADRAAANTPEEALKGLRQIHEYLAGLNGNLEHQGHEEKFLLIIRQAGQQKENHIMDKLNDVVVHMEMHKIISPEKLTDRLKSSNDAGAIHKDLVNACHNHYMNEINSNIAKISENDSVIVRGNKFTCPVKYLEHELAHQTHPYINREHMLKTISKVQQEVKQLQLEHSIGRLRM